MNDTTPLEPTPAPAETPKRRGVLRPILIGVGAGAAVLALGVGGFAIADAIDDAGDDRVVISSSDNPVPLGTTGSGDPSSSPSSTRIDDDAPISQDEYDRVTAAALAAVGGGTVTDVDREDDPGVAWQVDIRLANGDEAEVELAADLSVVRIDLDRED